MRIPKIPQIATLGMVYRWFSHSTNDGFCLLGYTTFKRCDGLVVGSGLGLILMMHWMHFQWLADRATILARPQKGSDAPHVLCGSESVSLSYHEQLCLPNPGRSEYLLWPSAPHAQTRSCYQQRVSRLLDYEKIKLNQQLFPAASLQMQPLYYCAVAAMCQSWTNGVSSCPPRPSKDDHPSPETLAICTKLQYSRWSIQHGVGINWSSGI